MAGPVRFTIEYATTAYLSNRSARKIAEATGRKYRTLVNQILAFAESKGYVMMDHFTQADMDQFYQGWKDGIRARGRTRTAEGVPEILSQTEDDQREPG